MNRNLGAIGLGLAALMLAVGAMYFALSLDLVPKVGLLAVAALLAMFTVSVVLGARVAGGVLVASATGLAFAGSLALAIDKGGPLSVVWGIVAYASWIAFSAVLFGTPVIVLPIPPFFIFAWQTLEGQRKREAILRTGSIAFLAVVASGVADFHRRRVVGDSSPPEAADASVNRSGSLLERAVRRALEDHGPAVTELTLRIDSANVVTIGGFVADSVGRSRAEELIREMPGVRHVANELRVR